MSNSGFQITKLSHNQDTYLKAKNGSSLHLNRRCLHTMLGKVFILLSAQVLLNSFQVFAFYLVLYAS